MPGRHAPAKRGRSGPRGAVRPAAGGSLPPVRPSATESEPEAPARPARRSQGWRRRTVRPSRPAQTSTPGPGAPPDDPATADLAATAQEKAFLAEKNVAWIRLLVIVFNVAVWYLVWDRSRGVPWLAATISVVATLYGAYVVAARPYRRFPVLRTSLFTAVTDAALITLWLVATGGGASPFYPLWFLSLFAVVFRYEFTATILASLLYILCDLGILLLDGTLAAAPGTALVRAMYLLLTGALGGLLARETFRQVGAQVRLRRRIESAEAAQAELRLVQELTAGLAVAHDLDSALEVVLRRASEAGGWIAAEAWVPMPDRQALRCSSTWSVEGGPLGRLLEAAPVMRLAPGEDLPGRAWAERGPVWSRDLGHDPGFSRRRAAVAAGVSGAVAVPILADASVVAVLVFYIRRVDEGDERLVRLLAAAAAQVGPTLQRKQAEERFRTLSEAALEGLCIHDHGIILEANSAFARLFGYAPEDLVGMDVRRLVPPDEVPRVEERLQLAGDTPWETPAMRRDGSTFLAEVNARDLPYQDRIVRVTAVRDVTERRKMEEADRLAMERQMEITRLQEVDRIKTRILNTASHELNTPLTPLKLQLHLLASTNLGPLTERQERAVQVLQRNVDRLGELVQDVLDVARLQGGGFRIQPRPLDMAEVVAEAVDAFGEAARTQGIELRAQVEGPLPVTADRNRLVQVLFNLVGNALKFTPAGGRIEVRATREGGRVRVEVADTGLGLSDDQIRRLFQPFSQVHDPAAVDAPGTGLGLYICKGIVEGHGGEIHATSPGPGHGTLLTFRVPQTPPARMTG